MSQIINVLIVGSNAGSIDAIHRCVCQQGDNVIVEGTALGFASGEKLLHEKKPSVLILDILPQEINLCLEWMKAILSKYPQTTIFAVCEDTSHETILDLLRAGATEYFLKPLSEADLSVALQKIGRMRGTMSQTRQPNRGKIYSVISAKNGVGVTTIAVNLASSIYKITKEPTIIVDLDLVGGDVATFLDLNPSYTIADFSSNVHRADINFLRGIVTKHASGISVLAKPHTMEEGIHISGDVVQKVLSLLTTAYRHVIVDTEANLTQTTMTAIDMSDMILLIFIMSLPGIKNTQRYMQYLTKGDVRGEKIKLVVNRSLKKFEIPLEKAEEILSRPVFWQVPNDFSAAMSCLNKGSLLDHHEPSSALNHSLEELARALTGNGETAASGEGERSPLLNRIFQTLNLRRV